MASQLKPEISLGYKGPQTMTLGELMGTATKAMEFNKLSELYPEIIGKAKAESKAAQLGYAQKELGIISSSMASLINNPMVVKAEQDPNSVNQQELLSYVTTHGMNLAKSLNIPEERATELMAPYIEAATTNPGQFRQFAKQRLIGALDSSAQTTIMGGPSAIGVPSIPENQPAFRPRGVTAADMTAPIQRPGIEPGIPVTTPEAIERPLAGAEPNIPRAAPAGGPIATAQAPTIAPTVTPPAQAAERPPLLYPVRKPGIQHAELPEENIDRQAGARFRDNLVARQSELTTARRNLQEVIKTATKLRDESVLPETGVVGAAKRGFANLIGDPTYKQLSKDLANVQIANMKAMGGSMDTVAGQQLTRMASGDETFPPEVLLSIAQRANADLTNIEMMATGLQKHAQKYGDANTKRFQQMWASNADSRVFELMNIQRDIQNPAAQEAAARKVVDGLSADQIRDLKAKRDRLLRLTTTGDY